MGFSGKGLKDVGIILPDLIAFHADTSNSNKTAAAAVLATSQMPNAIFSNNICLSAVRMNARLRLMLRVHHGSLRLHVRAKGFEFGAATADSLLSSTI